MVKGNKGEGKLGGTFKMGARQKKGGYIMQITSQGKMKDQGRGQETGEPTVF